MDYISIVKQLVELYPNCSHIFESAWPDEVEFPSYWGEGFQSKMRNKSVYINNGKYILHPKSLFKLTKYDVFIEVKDGKVSSVITNGFTHLINMWDDFDIDNPVLPEILNKVMVIIYGKDWMQIIPTILKYKEKGTYKIEKETSFVKPEKL